MLFSNKVARLLAVLLLVQSRTRLLAVLALVQSAKADGQVMDFEAVS